MTDEYRPTTFDEVVGQPVEQIQADIEDRPNFLFYGPAGTGKTTVAYLIAKRIHGTTDDLLECNASDDRHLDAVRERIIPVARQFTLDGHRPIIFLDEMDSMTKSAQQALRRPMEQAPAMFILACNDIDAVHEAVKSRCRVYAFESLTNAAIKERIRRIASDEGVPIDENRLSAIASFAAGDLRQAIGRYAQLKHGDLGHEPADERIAVAAQNLTDD